MGKIGLTHRDRRVAIRAVLTLAVAALSVAGFSSSALADAFATTAPATLPTPTSVTLNGYVAATQADTTWLFEYGTTTNYTQATPVQQAALGTTQVSAPVTGLQPGTTYHFQLIVHEGDYSEVDGGDQTFTTPATPGTVSTTGQATSITATTAELNAVANPSQPGSWLFQWGSSSAYGHITKTTTIASGLSLVSAKLEDLAPDTTYHFRLVVNDPGATPATSDGLDASFKTEQAFGKTTLRQHRLKVRRRKVAIPFTCDGIAGSICQGKVSLTTKTGSGTKARKVSCGSASLATKGGSKPSVSAKLTKRCAALLAVAPHHTIGAWLAVVFSSHQRRLSTGVKLLSSSSPRPVPH